MKEMETGNVTLANDDVKQKKAHKEKEIVPPVKEPNDIQKRRMLGQTMQIMMLAGMENHIYRFGNEIKKQKEGGPIGLSLTGEIADCYLIQRDNKFLEKLNSAGVNLILYERFKDDITIIGEELEKGSKWENGKVVIDEEKKKKDLNKHNEEVSMEIIVDIAESIDDLVKFTADMPCKQGNGKIAILDVAANINKEEGSNTRSPGPTSRRPLH